MEDRDRDTGLSIKSLTPLRCLSPENSVSLQVAVVTSAAAFFCKHRKCANLLCLYSVASLAYIE